MNHCRDGRLGRANLRAKKSNSRPINKISILLAFLRVLLTFYVDNVGKRYVSNNCTVVASVCLVNGGYHSLLSSTFTKLYSV